MSNAGRTILVVVLVLVALPLLWGSVMMGGAMGPGMMWGWDGGNRWGGWPGMWMMVPGILIVAGVIAALVWGLGNVAPAGGSGAPTARDILDARYARGEITREQYQEMKRDISS